MPGCPAARASCTCRICGTMDRALTSGPDTTYGNSDTNVACSNSEFGRRSPWKILSAAGDVGGLGNASSRYMICVKVKKLTPSGRPQFGGARRGPCMNAIASRNVPTDLKRNSTVMFTARPIHSSALRPRSSCWLVIARAITQLNPIDPRRSGKFHGLA